ncbi:MAG: hydrogenase maturation nickel metallochaperone HypA [Desulfovibrio sp.]|jgi:hydrogenase nickel incorporation protein HypA/HybF|nr:hydrogenase maturation nickel metallochaperone HypA [Desulfovibrio sp.]
MHEASLVQGLLSLVLETVRDHNEAHPDDQVERITDIVCDMGLLSCVEPQTLSGCMELLAEGTPAEGARLTLRTSPLPCTCSRCGAAFELTRRHFACPVCGGDELNFSGGHGLTLQSISVASSPMQAGEEEHARTH